MAFLYGCGGAAPLPPRAAALNRAGAEALAEGRLVEAEARLSLALEFHPRFVEALVNLAMVEMTRGNHERARGLLQRARHLNEDLPHAHHGLGVLAHRQQRVQEAADHYRQALKVDPAFVPSRANLARLLFDAGSLEEARVQFLRLVEVDRSEGRGHAGLVETLRRLGRRSDADEALARAEVQAGSSAPVQLLLARRALERGEIEPARTALRRLADERTDVAVSARAWLAVAELLRGDADAAVVEAERALEIDRHEPVATFAMAQALTARGDPDAPAWRERVQTPLVGVGPGAWPR